MLIDSSVVINLPSDGEHKVKKRQNTEEIKPVEKSGNSDEPELDINRDKVKRKAPETRRFDAGEIYNKYGAVEREGSRDSNSEIMVKSIDVVV